MTPDTLSIRLDPYSGRTFRQAIIQYSPRWSEKMEYAGLRLLANDPDALTADGLMRLQFLGQWLVFEQTERLRCGVQLARAFRPQSPTPLAVEDVPPEWWESVRVDLDANTAEANGTRLTGILVYPGIDRPHAAASQQAGVADGAEAPALAACLPKKKRGRKGQETERVKREMLADIDSKKHTLGSLDDLKRDSLAANYHTTRYTAVKALQAIAGYSNSNK